MAARLPGRCACQLAHLKSNAGGPTHAHNLELEYPHGTHKKATAKGGESDFGAAGGDRTHDPWLRRPILYPLSYSRVLAVQRLSHATAAPRLHCKVCEGLTAIMPG